MLNYTKNKFANRTVPAKNVNIILLHLFMKNSQLCFTEQEQYFHKINTDLITDKYLHCLDGVDKEASRKYYF